MLTVACGHGRHENCSGAWAGPTATDPSGRCACPHHQDQPHACPQCFQMVEGHRGMLKHGHQVHKLNPRFLVAICQPNCHPEWCTGVDAYFHAMAGHQPPAEWIDGQPPEWYRDICLEAKRRIEAQVQGDQTATEAS